MDKIIKKALEDFEKDFTFMYGEDNEVFHDHDDFLIMRDNFKSFLSSYTKDLLQSVVEANNPQLAEKIVIEYANISGRESEYRAYVREAAFKVLHSATEIIRKAIK